MNIVPEIRYRIIPEETYSGSCNYKYRVQKRCTFMGIFPYWTQISWDWNFATCEVFLKNYISKIKYFDKLGNHIANTSKVDSHKPNSYP